MLPRDPVNRQIPSSRGDLWRFGLPGPAKSLLGRRRSSDSCCRHDGLTDNITAFQLFCEQYDLTSQSSQQEAAMSLFRLDASIRGDLSVSRSVADTAEAAWRREDPSGVITRRDLSISPVPADAWQLALAAGFLPEDQRTEDHRRARALASELADELLAADAYLFALPLYNWGITQHVKAWLDLLMTDPRLIVAADPVLAGRPAALIVTRGGGYGPDTPKAGWDHATPYYRRFFGDPFGMNVHVNEVELTLAEAVPAMEPLRPLAHQLLTEGAQVRRVPRRATGPARPQQGRGLKARADAVAASPSS
jgi:FMN-dependent NADH-azoreductase